MLAGGVALAAIAGAVGVPAGAWTFRLVIARTDPSDGPDVATLPSALVLAAAIPAALLATAAVSAIAARQAARLHPAPALRAE